MKIIRHTVQAKSRALSARWQYEEQQGYTRIDPITKLSMTDLVQLWWITTRGQHVPFYNADEYANATAWCQEHTPGFTASFNRYPVTDSTFHAELHRRAKSDDWNGEVGGRSPYAGEYSTTVQDKLADMLAREIRHELDNEILRGLGVKAKPAHSHFFFVEKDHAVLFKLTWGGE